MPGRGSRRLPGAILPARDELVGVLVNDALALLAALGIDQITTTAGKRRRRSLRWPRWPGSRRTRPMDRTALDGRWQMSPGQVAKAPVISTVVPAGSVHHPHRRCIVQLGDHEPPAVHLGLNLDHRL
jgi:hypothetical protein